MKNTTTIIALTLLLAISGQSAPPPVPVAKPAPAPAPAPAAPSQTWLNSVSLEPYGTVSWLGLNGKAVTGAGANVVTDISKNLALFLSLESDNTQHSTADRGVFGLRLESFLTSRVRLDAGLGLGHDFEADSNFLRIPFGLTGYVIDTESYDIGVRAGYAFDITGGHNRGRADGRAFLGLVGTLKW